MITTWNMNYHEDVPKCCGQFIFFMVFHHETLLKCMRFDESTFSNTNERMLKSGHPSMVGEQMY